MSGWTKARLGAVVAGGASGALLLSGCGFGQLQLHTVAEAAAQSAAVISLQPDATMIDGQLAPDGPLVLQVAAGRFTGVTVTGPDGTMGGTLSPDATTWTSDTSSLEYGTRYEVEAAAVDRLGAPANVTESVQTLQPDKFLAVKSVSPSGKVGIGFPMKLNLSRNVKGKAARERVEKRLTVQANGKTIDGGAWRWDSGTELQYRPPEYWPGNSTITLNAGFKGLKVTKNVWGESDEVRTWKTGPAMISYVNLQTHEMKVTRDGKTLRTIPITGGKPGFDTRSGVKVILTKELDRQMDAATGGTEASDPEYYNIMVHYAMRVTWSGEFLHAAPWSVGSQGHSNVSHGCTGMSTSNAQWFFQNSEIGDIVEFRGSDRQMTMDNGVGDWNVPLDRWAAGYDS